jgi:hypothetical protein
MSFILNFIYDLFYCFIICFSFYVCIILIIKPLRNRSFELIKIDLNSRHEFKRLSAIKRIHLYLKTYSYEELLFFNLRWIGRQ